jgi:hypothetical protein
VLCLLFLKEVFFSSFALTFFTRAAVVDSSVRVPYKAQPSPAQPRHSLDGVAKYLLLKMVVTIEIENF